MTPRLIAAKSACKELGLAYSSFREIVFRGEIPVIKVGRAWYFRRTDLDAWVNTHAETLA